MSRLYLRRGEVASSHPVSTWQSVMFSEFEAQMSSEARPFPCVFGVAGYRQDQLRYLFLDRYDVEVLGAQLALARAKHIADRIHPAAAGTDAGRLLPEDVAYPRPTGAAGQESVAGRHPRTDRPSDVGVLVRG